MCTGVYAATGDVTKLRAVEVDDCGSRGRRGLIASCTVPRMPVDYSLFV